MTRIAIICAVLFAPFGVSGMFQRSLPLPIPLTVLVLVGAVIILFLKQMMEGKVILTPGVKIVSFLVFTPVIMSIIIGLPTGLLSDNTYISYFGYFKESSGRYINLALLSVFFVSVSSICSIRGKNIQRDFIYAYWIGCLVFILFGIWQAFHFYFGLPFIDLQTRAHLHSVPQALKALVPGRLTSIANEPSFFAPIIIDFLLISILMVNRRKIFFTIILTLSVSLLLLTFSFGGYLNALFLTIIILVIIFIRSLVRLRIKKKEIIFICILLLVVPCLFKTFGGYFEIVTARIPALFDLEHNSRAFMVFMPFVWLFESHPLNLLFGFGPKSYALIGGQISLPSGSPVHITSNNFFTDFAWEAGLIGLFSVIALFIILLRMSLTFNKIMTKEHWVGCLLTFHLMFSSLYRGDFFSLRFWVLLLIILILVDKGFSLNIPQKTQLNKP